MADVTVVYSNFAELRTSFNDLTIRFYRVSEVRRVEGEKEKGEAIPEEIVRVQMSPQHAKSFLRALENNLGKYESRYGEIKLPLPEQESSDGGRET